MVRILSAAAIVIAGCSSAGASGGSWDEVKTDSLTCSTHFEGKDVYGARACSDTLDRFLKDFPDERIASIVPLDSSENGVVETRSLLVLHTAADGPWLRARDLGVGGLLCEPRELAPSSLAHCKDGVLSEYATNRRGYILWFPVTGALQNIMYLYKR